MTIYTKVDTGTVDDDGSGDTLRAAFAKVNVNLALQDVAITLDEVASSADPGAAKGKLWVKNDSPNVLIFTDDEGTEIVLGAGGGGGGDSISDAGGDTQIQVEESANEDIIRFDLGNSIVGYPAQPDALIFSSGQFTLALPTADVATTVGGAISLTAGTGNTTGDGGDASLIGGVGGTTSGGIGGAVNLTGGAGGSGGGQGGGVVITSGAGTGSSSRGGDIEVTGGIGFNIQSGGNVELTAGKGGVNGRGGLIDIIAGPGGAVSGAGGAINIIAGSGDGSSGGGNIAITSGNAGYGVGGSMTITSGTGTGPYSGGALSLIGGLGGLIGPGGIINITGGSAGVTGDIGGRIDIFAGESTGTFTGAAVNITASDSGGGTTGNGGGVNIESGAAVSTNGSGGDIVLTPGVGNGSGSAGAINIVQTTAPLTTTDKLYNVAGALTWNGTDLTAGGGGSALEVEDNGNSLSIAVTKFNFIGFNVTEPVADEIQISFGVSAAANEYCPGYSSYTRVDDNEFTVDLVAAENLFYPGRRVKFDKAGTFTYGVISAVDFNTTSANDTHVTLTMEGADTVPTGVFDVCLVSSATAWSPIAGDPFSGSPINDICTGIIGSTQWWFAVGNAGKIATSNDGGATWTLRTTTTIENFNVCVYDSSNEVFWAGGDAGVLANSSNGTTITEDTTSIPALAGTETDNINGFSHSNSEDALVLIFHYGASNWRSVSSANQGSTWIVRASLGNLGGNRCLEASVTATGSTGPAEYAFVNSSTSLRVITTYNDTLFSTSFPVTPNIPISIEQFYDGAAIIVVGASNGAIIGISGWSGDDTTTFSNPINALAYSDTHSRVVCVGDNQQMGYWDAVDKTVNDAWNTVSNGFSPTANITAVDWNSTDGVFVAVANNGQICRSTNGTN